MKVRTIVLVAAAAGGVMWDQSRPVSDRWSTGAAVAGVHLHQRLVSPLLTRMGYACRFEPSCSRYAEVVLARDGVLDGGLKVARRLVACGPWTPMGTQDPP